MLNIKKRFFIYVEFKISTHLSKDKIETFRES